MQIRDFYEIVKQMRQMQRKNSNAMTIGDKMRLYKLESKVDKELMRVGTLKELQDLPKLF
jgi:hypothetical protein